VRYAKMTFAITPALMTAARDAMERFSSRSGSSVGWERAKVRKEGERMKDAPTCCSALAGQGHLWGGSMHRREKRVGE